MNVTMKIKSHSLSLYVFILAMSMDGLSFLQNEYLRVSVLVPILIFVFAIMRRPKIDTKIDVKIFLIFFLLVIFQILISIIISPNNKSINYLFGYVASILVGASILVMLSYYIRVLGQQVLADKLELVLKGLSIIVLFEFTFKLVGYIDDPFSLGLDRMHYSQAVDSFLGIKIHRSYGFSLEPTYLALFLNSIQFFIIRIRKPSKLTMALFYLAIFSTLSTIGVLVAMLLFKYTRLILVIILTLAIILMDPQETIIYYKLVKFYETERFLSISENINQILRSPIFGSGPGFVSDQNIKIFSLLLLLGIDLGLLVPIFLIIMILLPVLRSHGGTQKFGSVGLMLYLFTFPSFFAPGFWIFLCGLHLKEELE